MGTEIDRLEIQVETQASKANRQLDELISKLGKLAGSLSSINSGSIKQFAAGMNEVSAAARNLSAIKAGDMNRVVTNLQKLGGIKTGNMFNVGNALLSVSRGMQGFSGVTGADIPAMVTSLSSLSKLGNKGIKSAAASMPMLAKNLQSMAATINGVNINPEIPGQLSAISSTLRTFGHKSMKTAIDNMPALSQGLKSLMQTLSTAPKVSANLVNLVNALSKLSSSGSGIRAAANAVQSVGKNSANTTSRMQSLSNSLANFTNKTKAAKQSTKSFSFSLSSLYANCFFLIRGLKAIGRAVESSMDYIETFNYFNVTMSKIASEFSGQWEKYGYESAEAYGKSFAGRLNDLTQKMSGYKVGDDGVLSITGGQNLSLDPEQLMNYQSNIAAVTNSVGLMGENSVNTAKALTMLAADMSSLKNIDMSTVMNNFQSGLIGQSRALYKYGIDITNATLQTYAYKYGIETALQEMTQADKMQLRLLAILDQSKVAWGDMANTLSSVANQYRILKQQIANLARVIGNLLVPIVAKALPIINGVVIALQRMFMFIGNLLGVDWSGLMDGISTGYGGAGDEIGDMVDDTGDIADNTDDIGDSIDTANKKAKKFKDTILSFDELNKLSDNSSNDIDSSGKTDKDDGISGAGSIDLSDEIAKALADYESIWNKALEDSQNKAQAYADNICKAFERIWKTAEPTRAAVSRLWDEGFAKLGKFSADTFKDFWNNFLKPVGAWMLADDAGLPRFFNITNDLLNDIDWNRLRKSLADFYTSLQSIAKFSWNALMDFYEGFLKPIAVWTMSDAIPQLVDIMTEFVDKVDWDKINKALREFWDALAPFAKSVGKGLIDFFSKLMDFGADFLNNVVPGGIKGLADALKKISPEQAEKIGEALGKIALAIIAFKGIGSIIKKIADLGLALASIKDGLGIIFGSGGIFATIGNTIKKFVSSIGSFGGKILSVYTSMSKGAMSLGEAIGNVFPKIGSIISGVSSIASGIGSAFAAAAGALGISTGAMVAIVAGAVAAIVAVVLNWDEIKEFFTQTLPNWWNQSVVPWIKSIPEFFKELPGKIYDKIVTTKDKFVEWATDIWETASAGVKRVVDDVVGYFKELPGKIYEKIIATKDKFVDWASSVLEAASTGVKKIIDSVEAFFKELPGKIGYAIGFAIGKVASWAVELYETVVAEIPKIIEKVVEFFKALPGKIWDAIITVKGKFVEWASNVLEVASSEVKKVIESVVGFFKELPEKIKSAIDFAIEKVRSWAGKLYETVTTEIPKVVGKVVEFFKTLPGKIWDAIISAKNKISKWANSIWTVLSQKVPEIITNVYNLFKKLPEKIWNAIIGAVKNIGKWCSEMYQKVIEEVPKIVGKVIDYFKELPGKIYEIGKNLIKGFIKGIKDFFQSGINAVGDFVDGVVRGFRDGFDVHSPSRVMYDIAKNVVAGFGNGINNNWGGVTKNLSNLLGQTKSSISNTLYGIGEMGRSTINNLVRGFSNIHIPLPHLGISWTRYTVGNRRFSVPDFNINWYANGGFPESGELFMARERGPELVGKMGNRNVVANNNQITDGIKRAVIEGMMEVAMALNTGGKENTSPIIENTFKVDSETFYRMVQKGKEKHDRRFHVIAEF